VKHYFNDLFCKFGTNTVYEYASRSNTIYFYFDFTFFFPPHFIQQSVCQHGFHLNLFRVIAVSCLIQGFEIFFFSRSCIRFYDKFARIRCERDTRSYGHGRRKLSLNNGRYNIYCDRATIL